MESRRDKSVIGFFGAPGSGKSTLMNRFLQVDLLPSSAFGFGGAGIPVVVFSEHLKKDFTVSLPGGTGNLFSVSFDQLEEAAVFVEHLARGQHTGTEPHVHVSGCFKTLKNGASIIDVPGLDGTVTAEIGHKFAVKKCNAMVFVTDQCVAGSYETVDFVKATTEESLSCCEFAMCLTRSANDIMPGTDVRVYVNKVKEQVERRICGAIGGYVKSTKRARAACMPLFATDRKEVDYTTYVEDFNRFTEFMNRSRFFTARDSPV